MYYWDMLKKQNQYTYKPPEKFYCKICGKEIPKGSMPRIRYGVGIICKECSEIRLFKGMKKNKK
jgi:DNA-directed RNA polymerase subunit RPC12/RpoP